MAFDFLSTNYYASIEARSAGYTGQRCVGCKPVW